MGKARCDHVKATSCPRNTDEISEDGIEGEALLNDWRRQLAMGSKIVVPPAMRLYLPWLTRCSNTYGLVLRFSIMRIACLLLIKLKYLDLRWASPLLDLL